MWRYVLKRVLWLIIIALCVAMLIFTIMWFVPGDPAQIILGSGATQADIQALRDKMGLNDPFLKQLGTFMSDIFLHLDFGDSYIYKTPVMDEFLIRLPRTFLLALCTILIHVIVGIPVGVTAGMHRNSFRDKGLLVFAMIFISIPNFWLALMMVQLFSLKLGWLPSAGIGGIKYWIMPILASSIAGIANNARQTRSAVLETVRADFVTTARAKGLPERSVIYKHMLPNALIPVVNGLGMEFSGAIAGTVVIESVFSFPGVGTYLLTAITSRDYPVIRGCILVLALFAAVVNLLVDLIYAMLDPRIKAQYVNYAASKKGSRKGGKG